MKKSRLILPLIFLALGIVFSPISASAEGVTRGTLRNTCASLSTYIYPMVYQNEAGYDAFSDALSNAKAAAADINVSDEDIQTFYNELKDAYIQLMKSTYRYDGLETIVEMEQWLDTTLYEEKSVEEFQKQLELCRAELTSPRIYELNDRSVAEYKAFLQSRIDETEAGASDAYNALRFKAFPETYSAKNLRSFLSGVSSVSELTQLQKLDEWADFFNAEESAKALLEKNKQTDAEIQKAAENLLKSYDALIRKQFDFSAAANALNQYENFTKSDYTASSWKQYESEKASLALSLSQPLFFYVPAFTDESDQIQYVQNLIDSIAGNAVKAADELVSLKSIQELKDLCDRYQNVSVTEQLGQYDSALIRAVENGKALLEREDVTVSEIQTATSTIEGAAEQLKLATESLNEAETKEKNDRSREIKLILGSTLVTLLLSLGLAFFLSLRQNGEIDWTR